MEFLLLIPILALALSALMVLTKKPPYFKGHILYALSWISVLVVCFIDVIYLVPEFKISFFLVMLLCIMGLLHPVLHYLATCDMANVKGIEQRDWMLTALPVIFIILALMLATGLSPEEKNQFIDVMFYGKQQHEPQSSFFLFGVVILYGYIGVIIVSELCLLVWGIIKKLQYKVLLLDYNKKNSNAYSTKDAVIVTTHVLGLLSVVVLSLIPLFAQFVSGAALIAISVVATVSFIVNGRIVYRLQFPAKKILGTLSTATPTDLSSDEVLTNEKQQGAKNEDGVSNQTDADETPIVNAAPQYQNSQDDIAKDIHGIKSVLSSGIQSADAIKDILKNEPTEYVEEQVSDSGSSSYQLPKSTVDKIRSEQLFLDPEISLNVLAEKLNTNRTYLSQAIRQYYHTNLAGFIKDLRMEYVISRISSTPLNDVVMQEVAFDAGYTNIASFYKDFMSVIGCTPRQFVQQKR